MAKIHDASKVIESDDESEDTSKSIGFVRPPLEKPVGQDSVLAPSAIPEPATPTVVDDAVETPEPREKHGIPATALMHGGQGAAAGFIPALTGAANVVFQSPPVRAIREATGIMAPYEGEEDASASVGDQYRAGRDHSKELLKETAEDNPTTAVVTGMAGSVISPTNKIGAGAKGIVGAASTAAKQGAISSLGYSDADLTKGEVVDAAKDVAIGTGISGVAGAVGGTLSKAKELVKEQRMITKALKDRAEIGLPTIPLEGQSPKEFRDMLLKQAADEAAVAAKDKLTVRILNEITEGETGMRTTATQAKHLDKASENITHEFTAGPDSKKVRAAVLGPAKDGREKLQPIISKLGEKNAVNYDKFEQAGKSLVDADAYESALEDAFKAANKKGDVEGADLLSHIKDKFRKMREVNESSGVGQAVEDVTDGGLPFVDVGGGTGPTTGIDLKGLRGFTTTVQASAASAVGGLNGHRTAVLKAKAAAFVTDAMYKAVEKASSGNPALKKAAEEIAETNKRLNALLTISQALGLRQAKEQSQRSGIQRFVNGAAAPMALGAAGAGAGVMLGGDDRSAAAPLLAGAGLALGGLRRTAWQQLERAAVTRAIAEGRRAAQDLATKGVQGISEETVARQGQNLARAAMPIVRQETNGDDRPDYSLLSRDELTQALLHAAKSRDPNSLEEIRNEIKRRNTP